MKKYDQLNQSIKKWNEEEDLARWEIHYQEDSYNGNRLRAREKKLLKYLDDLNLKKGAKILELGYGAGITSSKIYSRGFNIIGIDISDKLCKLAIENCKQRYDKKNKTKFEFKIGNAEKLEFKENTFDCVVGLGFLQYLEKPMSCMKEAYRVLKPKGYFIITQRNMYGISSLDGPIKLIRSLFYLLTNRRYELRWQDTVLFYPILLLATLTSPISKYMKKLKKSLIQHKRIGLVKKNALSFGRMRKMIKKANFRILRYDGAGYLTKKYKLFPKLARKLDNYLQNASDKKSIPNIHKFGNSSVFLAQKK